MLGFCFFIFLFFLFFILLMIPRLVGFFPRMKRFWLSVVFCSLFCAPPIYISGRLELIIVALDFDLGPRNLGVSRWRETITKVSGGRERQVQHRFFFFFFCFCLHHKLKLHCTKSVKNGFIHIVIDVCNARALIPPILVHAPTSTIPTLISSIKYFKYASSRTSLIRVIKQYIPDV